MKYEAIRQIIAKIKKLFYASFYCISLVIILLLSNFYWLIFNLSYNGWKYLAKSGLFRFHESEAVANYLFYEVLVCTHPVVFSSLLKKLINAVRIVSTFQQGFQVSGWKSEMDRHILCFGANLPLGVIIIMPGGFIGYSVGNINLPW